VTHTPLPGRAQRAVQGALLSHGWEGASSEAAVAGLEPWAHHVTGLSSDQVEALLRSAPKFGVDLLTGDDWAILAATKSRLSAFARSWTLPPELHDLAVGLGTGLPADPASGWRVGNRVIDLSTPVVVDRLPPGVVEIASDRAASLLNQAARRGEAGGGGILLTATDPANALLDLGAALEAVLVAGLDAETIALDPGWTPGRTPLAIFRRFGRPLVCSTDDPVIAALARIDGAQIFRTGQIDPVRRAVDLVDGG